MIRVNIFDAIYAVYDSDDRFIQAYKNYGWAKRRAEKVGGYIRTYYAEKGDD